MVPGRTLFFLFASPSPLFQRMLEAYITPTPGMKHGPADATIAVLVVVTIASAYVVVAVKAASPVSRSAVELPSSPLSPAEAGAQLASRRAAARHASATRYLYCCNSAYELRISPNGVSPKPAQSMSLDCGYLFSHLRRPGQQGAADALQPALAHLQESRRNRMYLQASGQRRPK